MIFNFFTRWGEAMTAPTVYDANYNEATDGTDQLVLRTNASVDKGVRVVWRDADTDEYHEHIVSSIREVHDKTGRVQVELTCINSIAELYAIDHTGQIGSGGTSGYNDTVTIDAQEFFDLILTMNTRWNYGGAGTYGTAIGNVTIGKTTDSSVREIMAAAMSSVAPLNDRPAELRAVPTVDPTTGAVTARTLYAFYPIAPEDATKVRRFTYSKNLLSATREVRDTEIYTACRAIGAEIEVDGEVTGRHEASVWDDDFLEMYGIPDAAGNMTHAWMRVFCPECDDDSYLQSLASYALMSQLHPDVEYTVNLAEMRDVKLGDYVDVIDTSFFPELRVRVRVTEIQKNLMSGAVSGNTSSGSGSGGSGSSSTSSRSSGVTSGRVRMGSTSTPASIEAYQKATDNAVTAAKTTVSTESNVTVPAKINELQAQINKLKSGGGSAKQWDEKTYGTINYLSTTNAAVKHLYFPKSFDGLMGMASVEFEPRKSVPGNTSASGGSALAVYMGTDALHSSEHPLVVLQTNAFLRYLGGTGDKEFAPIISWKMQDGGTYDTTRIEGGRNLSADRYGDIVIQAVNRPDTLRMRFRLHNPTYTNEIVFTNTEFSVTFNSFGTHTLKFDNEGKLSIDGSQIN